MAKTKSPKSYAAPKAGKGDKEPKAKATMGATKELRKGKILALMTESGLGPAQGVYIGAQIKDTFDRRIPFDIFGLNVITRGGMVFNAITEIVGPPATFKTTIALGLVKQTQLRFGADCVIVWLSTENGVDINWARHQGVRIPYSDDEIINLKKMGIEGEALKAAIKEQSSCGILILLAGDSIEHDCDRAKALIDTGEVSLFVLDSLGAISAEAEREAESIGDSQVTVNVRLIGKLVRYLHSVGNKLTSMGAETGILLVNQVRAKIGGAPSFGVQYHVPSGWQMKHGKVLSLETRMTGTMKDGDTTWGKQITVKVEKSKICIPHRTCTITYVVRGDNPMRLAVGPDACLETLELAKDVNLIHYVAGKGGGWLFGQTPLMFNGEPAKKEDLVFALRADPLLLKQVQDDVVAYHRSLEIK